MKSLTTALDLTLSEVERSFKITLILSVFLSLKGD